jgi:hypothetical protein
LGDVDVDVIVDAGRIGPGGLPGPLVERSALTAVVLGSTLRAVMSARVHLPTVTAHSRPVCELSPSVRNDGRRGGTAYGRGEISKALGVPVIAGVARDRRPPRTWPTARRDHVGSTRRRWFAASAVRPALSAASCSARPSWSGADRCATRPKQRTSLAPGGASQS